MSLVLDNVELRLADRCLLEPLSVSVEPGVIVTVQGPSGSGKSSLLAHVAGFLDQAVEARGRVSLDGVVLDDLPAHRRRVGLLFQDPLLFAHLSVAGNLLFALPRAVRGRAARRARVHEALAGFGLADRADADPATLSGGERARVCLLQTLLAEPRALLLDEPFASLDTALRADIRAQVFERLRRERLPCLLVTHDAADAAAAGGPVRRPWTR
ncbi:MAG: ATP-binding cassette domain-containing protein [Geminicoccaceae bacterium]|nr:ATP-binding cassette domain-containing protein [Geminicoccaceae bacterium]